MVLALVLAQVDEPSILAPLLNYGVVGLFLVGMLLGQVIPGWLYKQVRADLAEQRAANVALRAQMDDKVIPMLNDMGTVLRDALQVVNARPKR